MSGAMVPVVQIRLVLIRSATHRHKNTPMHFSFSHKCNLCNALMYHHHHPAKQFRNSACTQCCRCTYGVVYDLFVFYQRKSHARICRIEDLYTRGARLRGSQVNCKPTADSRGVRAAGLHRTSTVFSDAKTGGKHTHTRYTHQALTRRALIGHTCNNRKRWGGALLYT